MLGEERQRERKECSGKRWGGHSEEQKQEGESAEGKSMKAAEFGGESIHLSSGIAERCHREPATESPELLNDR